MLLKSYNFNSIIFLTKTILKGGKSFLGNDFPPFQRNLTVYFTFVISYSINDN